MGQVVEVAAGVLVRDGHVLVCQRRADATHPGQWEFPGGKRQPGETLTACLARELDEELGIDAEVGPEVWRTRYYYRPHVPLDLFFFHVLSYRGCVTNRAFADLRWVRGADWEPLDFLEADRPLVAWLARQRGTG